MKTDWIQVMKQVWEHKIQYILSIIGTSIAVAVIPGLPLWLSFVISIMGVVWLAYVIISESRNIKERQREKSVPLMVIVGCYENRRLSMKREVMTTMKSTDFDEQQYKKRWDLIESDFEIYQEHRLPVIHNESWKRLVQQFGNKVERVDKKLPNRTIFHLFLNCPAVLALAFGARCTTHHEVVLYHYQPGSTEGPYIPLIDLSRLIGSDAITRSVPSIREKIQTPYRFIRVTSPNKNELREAEVLVKVYMGGQDPTTAVEKIATSQDRPLVHIDRLSHRTLPTTKGSWLRVAREIGTALMEVDSQAKRVHLYWSAPVVLAFAVGMAVGKHSPITLYHWNSSDSTYYEVLKLESLTE